MEEAAAAAAAEDAAAAAETPPPPGGTTPRQAPGPPGAPGGAGVGGPRLPSPWGGGGGNTAALAGPLSSVCGSKLGGTASCEPAPPGVDSPVTDSPPCVPRRVATDAAAEDELGLWRLSSGGPSSGVGLLGKPLGPPRPLGSRAVWLLLPPPKLTGGGGGYSKRLRCSTAAAAAGGAAVLEAAVGPLELARRLDHELDAIGAFVVDAAPAHGLREVPDHGPGHAGQVAQVARLSPGRGHLCRRHDAAGRPALGEGSRRRREALSRPAGLLGAFSFFFFFSSSTSSSTINLLREDEPEPAGEEGVSPAAGRGKKKEGGPGKFCPRSWRGREFSTTFAGSTPPASSLLRLSVWLSVCLSGSGRERKKGMDRSQSTGVAFLLGAPCAPTWARMGWQEWGESEGVSARPGAAGRLGRWLLGPLLPGVAGTWKGSETGGCLCLVFLSLGGVGCPL